MEELEPRLRELETKVALNKSDIERVEQNSKNWWKEMGDDLKDVKHQLGYNIVTGKQIGRAHV